MGKGKDVDCGEREGKKKVDIGMWDPLPDWRSPGCYPYSTCTYGNMMNNTLVRSESLLFNLMMVRAR